MTALQPKVAKLINYVRGQAWIAPPVGFQPLLKALGRESTEQENDCESHVNANASLTRACQRTHVHHVHGFTVVFTPQEIERFKTDSEFFWKARHAVDASLNVSLFGMYMDHYEAYGSMLLYAQSWNDATILGSSQQVLLRENLTKSMRSRLFERPDIAEKRECYPALRCSTVLLRQSN